MSIFTRAQEAELITAVQGRGEIPLKFVYLGPKGAINWDNIVQIRSSTVSGINSEEGILLQEKISAFLDALPKNMRKINIIDIGCGNGYPVFPVLKALSDRKIKFRYVPLDISQEMIDLAVKNIKKEFGNVQHKDILFDFEQGNFANIAYNLKSDRSYNLFLYFGSTLGNQPDMGRVLSNFRDSMDANDYMLIGVQLSNLAKIDEILAHYDVKYTADFLYHIPEVMGISKKDTSYNVIWNDLKNQVEIRIQLKNDQKVKIGQYQFVLKKSERIFLSRSVKFTSWTLTKLLTDVGFRTEILATDKANTYTLSMVQPTRYV